MTDFYDLYTDLLVSPCAEMRMQGIARWAEHGGPIVDLLPLLRDPAPVLRWHGGHAVIVEVRAAALVALQDMCRLGRRTWDLGPVTVRRAMPAEEAARRAAELLARLATDRQGSVLAAVDQALARTVVPPTDADRRACHDYLVLLELGEVDYVVQEVNGRTWLTPLQEEIHASQMASPRPRPHVRFDGEVGPVGYLYRAESASGRADWVLDFDESPVGREIAGLVRQWMGVEKGGVPRVLFDAEGRPLLDSHGRAFQLDGTVPADTDEPLDYLHSVAAFVARHHRCQVVP
jgi:hypothetical protein